MKMYLVRGTKRMWDGTTSTVQFIVIANSASTAISNCEAEFHERQSVCTNKSNLTITFLIEIEGNCFTIDDHS